MIDYHANITNSTHRLACFLSLAILATGLASGCASMRPTLQSVSARVVAIDFEGVELAFDVDVKNNTFIGLHTPRGRYALRVAEKDVISSDTIPATELPAGIVGTITLPARITYLSLWELVHELKNSAELPYEMEGAMIFDIAGQSLSLDFAHAGDLPVLKLPKVSITDVDTSGFSLRGTNVTVSAQLTNPNIFALGISELGYELKLGNVEIGRVEVNTPGLVDPGASCVLTARCKLAATSAASSVLKGGELGSPKLTPVGAVNTPYGAVSLPGQ